MDEALIRLQEEELRRTGRYYKHKIGRAHV